MKTLRCSSNELATVVGKAALSSGLPQAQAEDIGRAAVWLASSGIGISAIMDVVCVEPVSFPDPPVVLDGTLDLLASEIRLHLSSALDLLQVSAADRLLLRDINDWWLPLALTASWRADGHSAEEQIWDFRADDVPLAQVCQGAVFLFVDKNPRSCSVLQITLTDKTPETPPTVHKPAASVPGEHPCRLAFAHWNSLQHYAARRLVPASVESRSAGAGAGLLDND